MTTITHYFSGSSQPEPHALHGEMPVEGEEHSGVIETHHPLSAIPPGVAEQHAALHVLPQVDHEDNSIDSIPGGVEALPPPIDGEEIRKRAIEEKDHQGDDNASNSNNSSSDDIDTDRWQIGGVTVITNGGGDDNLLDILVQAINRETRESQLDSSLTNIDVNSNQKQARIQEKLDNLKAKLSSQETSLALKIFTWLGLIVGAIAAALTLGAMSGPLALVAGIIGLAAAAYAIGQQVAAEIDPNYYPGKEFAYLAEACGMSAEDAERFAVIFNTVLQTVLALLGALAGIGAAMGIGARAADAMTDLGQLGKNMTQFARMGEMTSTATDMGSAGTGIADSSVGLHNGLLDADSQKLQAELERLGMSGEQLIMFLQRLMEFLNDLSAQAKDIIEHFFESLQHLAQRPQLV